MYKILGLRLAGSAAETQCAGNLVQLALTTLRRCHRSFGQQLDPELEKAIIGDRIRVGMAKAQADGKTIGKPGTKVNGELVVQLRAYRTPWSDIAQAHPQVQKSNGKRGEPSPATIRRVYAEHKGQVETMVAD